MSEIKLATDVEIRGYNEVVKTYNYKTGVIIRVLAKKGSKKHLFQYDATFSEAVDDTSIIVLWTFDKNIFAVATSRNERFKFVESHFN